MSDTQPPLDFFLTSSAIALQSFELSRMNRAANLRKELRQIAEEWIQAEVNARYARLVLESRRLQALASGAGRFDASGPAAPRFAEQLPISFLPAHQGLNASLSITGFSDPPMAAGVGAAVTATAAQLAVPSVADLAPTFVSASSTLPLFSTPPSMSSDAARFPATPPQKGAAIGAGSPSANRSRCASASLRKATTVGAATVADPDAECPSEFAGESASALDRCARQSVAVLHSLPRRSSRLRNGFRACRLSRAACATLVQQEPAPASGRDFRSRAFVDAVA
jgi:hypothetical protein